jgi:hypothetical protein
VHVCPLGESALFAFGFFVAGYPSATFLSKRLLPKALKNRNMKIFILQLIALTLLLAFIFALFTKGFVWLEHHGVFPRSALLSGMNRPFYAEYIGNLLSAFMTNVAFCTFRFFEEHYRTTMVVNSLNIILSLPIFYVDCLLSPE